MTGTTTASDAARYSAYLLLSLLVLMFVALCADGFFDVAYKGAGSIHGPALSAAPAPGGSLTGFPGLPVDLNTATVEDLVALPGIGPKTAAVIVAMRDERGGFRSVAELGEINWLGPTRLGRLDGLVTVTGADSAEK